MGERQARRRTRPTLEEVLAYAETIDGGDVDWAEEWYDEKERHGWIAGGRPIRYWEKTLEGYLMKREVDRRGGV